MQKLSAKFREIKIAILIAVMSFSVLGLFPKAVFATMPTISNIVATPSTTTARINWDTVGVSSDSVVEYGPTISYGNTKLDSTLVINHDVTIAGLLPGTIYNFRVKSTNGTDQEISINQTFTTAVAPIISNVRIAQITDSLVTITWDTNVGSYGFIGYGATVDYGQLVGNEEMLKTSHSITIAGFDPGSTKHYLPRVRNLDGNYYYYATDSTFTTGSPYITSFSSSTGNGTYGPTSDINITANYTDSASNNLGGASTVTVLLNNGVSVILNTVGANTLTGTYTVGATASGQDRTNLAVSSITAQNVCDTNPYCNVGLTMPATNISDGINVDTTAPTFTTQYYSDSGLTASLGNNPRLKAGTYYIKITSNEALSGTPTITIGAQGTANNVTGAATTSVSGNVYSYTRTISYDAAATGTVKEDFSITGTDVATNTATNANPTNETTTAGYTDTIKPTASGSITPTDYAKAGSVSVSLTFNENMDQTVAPTVVIRKSDVSTIAVSGSYISATQWSGTATVVGGDANGTASLEVTNASDLAGNVMDANTSIDQVLIDTASPTFTINSGTDAGPTKTDVINVSVFDADPSSAVASRYYGYSTDNVCDASDTIDIAFTSGTDFSITGNHTDYLCVRSLDGAGNIGYQLVGQLNTDNTAPTITNVNSDHANGTFKAGEIIDIDVNFSENITSTGNITVTLETGATDRTCAFAVANSNSGTCNYTVQAGDTSSDLSVDNIAGTIADQVGNAMVNFSPATNLAANKDIAIDTTAPGLDIVFPINGNDVNNNSVVLFNDNATNSPQCWITGYAPISCTTGVTLISALPGWDSIGNGDYFVFNVSDTDPVGNTGSDQEINIKKDTTAPTITSVTATSGYYKAGQTIDITFNFSKVVTSTGSVSVDLNSGGLCSFTVDSSALAVCHYTVQAGENIFPLDTTVSGINGIITDGAGNQMTDMEPVAKLSAYNIAVDTTAPDINSVTTDKSAGTYVAGTNFVITVNFNDSVKLSSTDARVSVILNTGGSCTFSMDAYAPSGSCTYTVADGENNANLQVASIAAVSGSIQDRALNILTDFSNNYTNLPSGIIIDTTNPGSPTIDSITSTDGYYKAGDNITVDFTFSEEVTTDGNNVTVNFDSGGTCTFAIGSLSSGASCVYHVLDTQNSADLEATVSQFVDIKDSGNSKMTDFVPTAGLRDNYAVVVDTTNPSAPTSVSLTDPINDANKNVVTLSGNTSEPGATIIYSIDDANSDTTAISGQQVVAQGDFAITVNLSSLDGGTITATVSQKDLALNQSSSVAPAPTATSAVTKPLVASITSTTANGYYNTGDAINITVNFSEAVSSTGIVRVNLNTDKYCNLAQLANESVKSCIYTVQAGDNADPLSVTNIVGTGIVDQQGNVMVDFSPQINLANISVDTGNPDNPTVNLEDIIDANKASVTLAGNGESGTTAYYSINDANNLTAAITGSTAVSAGAYSVQVDLSSLDGGTITGTVYLADLAGNSSSSVDDTASSSVVKPTISSVTSTTANGNYNTGDSINITVNFSEIISSTQSTRVNLNTGRYCDISQFNNESSVSCDYIVQAGDNVASLDVTSISTSGDLRDQESDLLVDFSIGANLSASKNIVIDTNTISLSSFTSDKPAGIYGPGTAINISANYSEDINTAPAPTMSITLDTGAQITLSTIGPDNKKLIGVYTVGATNVSSENTFDLTVASIQSQNVCDLSGNCQTGTTVPANNNISDTSAIEIDTESPKFSSLLPDSSSNILSITTDSNISYSISENLQSGVINIDADDDSQHFNCVLGGNFLLAGDHEEFDVANCDGPTIELTPGLVYDFTFSGSDPYNNQSRTYSRVAVSYMWDENKPTLGDPTATQITPTSVVIEWTTDKDANSFVDLGTDLTYSLMTVGNQETFSMSHQITINNLSPDTEYFYRIRSVDNLDNHNEGINDNIGEGYTFTTTSLPSISGVVVDNITTGAARINWSSDLDAYSYIDYGTTESYGQIIGNEATLTKNHTMTVAGLNVGAIYYFRTRTKDIDGNYSLGSGGSFTTLAAGSGAPTISSIKSDAGANASMGITWKTSTVCNGMVRYGLDKNYGQSAGEDITIAAVTSFAIDHAVNIGGLLSNSTYHYAVVSYDAAGNIAMSADQTFSTPALSSISGVRITDVTLASVTIIWETGDPTTSEVDYGFTTAYGKNVTNKTLANLHKVELTSLEAGKTYHFRINGLSKDDKSIFSDDYIFATNDKPVISGNGVDEVTDSKATIKWTTNVIADSLIEYVNKDNPEDKGVQGLSDLSTDHKVILNGLNQGSKYEVKIKSTDVNKNLVESEPFEITTDKDVQAPKISQVNTESSLINGKEDKVQSIIFWKTDESSTSQVTFSAKKGGGDEASTQQSKEDLNLSTNHVVVLTNLKPGVVYYFQVISRDRNDNIAKSEYFSLLTPQKQQSVIQLIIANFEQTFGWMKKMKM